MNRQSYRIYCAGPLFNPKEREEMGAIASALRNAGYLCFLPQDDGLHFAAIFPELLKREVSRRDASRVLNEAIFCLDVFEIIESHGLVLNMNGRVPDEGAMVEAGIAWARDKPIVIYKNDDRSLIQGTCNPLVMGLAEFQFVTQYEDVPTAFDAKFNGTKNARPLSGVSVFRKAKSKGKTISQYLSEKKSSHDIAEILIELFAEDLCRSKEKNSPKAAQARMEESTSKRGLRISNRTVLGNHSSVMSTE